MAGLRAAGTHLRHLDELPASAPLSLLIRDGGSSRMLRLPRIYTLKPLHSVNPSVTIAVKTITTWIGVDILKGIVEQEECQITC